MKKPTTIALNYTLIGLLMALIGSLFLKLNVSVVFIGMAFFVPFLFVAVDKAYKAGKADQSDLST